MRFAVRNEAVSRNFLSFPNSFSKVSQVSVQASASRENSALDRLKLDRALSIAGKHPKLLISQKYYCFAINFHSSRTGKSGWNIIAL